MLKADCHIHTVLSACASLDMSPKKIIEKAMEESLDVIAITDHNGIANCEVAIKLGEENNIVVIPGMEVTVKEEFHIVTLFPDLEKARNVYNKIYDSLLPLEIDEEKMGYQLQVDKDENIVSFEKRVLNQGSLFTDELISLVEENEGIIIFSHIDRPYFSIIASLGFIPDQYKRHIFELTKDEKDYGLERCVKSSDSHFVKDIGRRYFFVNSEKNIQSIFDALKKGDFFL